MNARRVATLVALPVLAILAGACVCVEESFGTPKAKFCGRDYGDRIHWTPVPSWFTPTDCTALYLDGALWSDLYLGCYTRKGGFLAGGDNLGLPLPNVCRWVSFKPAEARRLQKSKESKKR